MSPFRIDVLLRLHGRPFPLEGLTLAHSNSELMHYTFDWLRKNGLLKPGVALADLHVQAARHVPLELPVLTDAGLALVKRLTEVEP